MSQRSNNEKFVDLSQDNDNRNNNNNNNKNNNKNNNSSSKNNNSSSNNNNATTTTATTTTTTTPPTTTYISEEIQFIPHFTTLTDGGKSHFNRIADGLAEFVDNSMEACKKRTY